MTGYGLLQLAVHIKNRLAPGYFSDGEDRPEHGIPVNPAYIKARRQYQKVEMLFAHMKRILKLDRLRLCGMSGAHDELLLTATVQNLRRMTKLLSQSPPDSRIAAPA